MDDDTTTYDELSARFADEWKKVIEDKNSYDQVLLSFAKVGIFNPYNDAQRIAISKSWAAGRWVGLEDYWLVHRWMPTDPIVIRRAKVNVIDKTERLRKTSLFLESFEIEETNSPLQVTAHALGRYRERAGAFVLPEEFWKPIPNLISSVDSTVVERRKDIILPTENGAWLGEPLLYKPLIIVRYKKKKLDMFEPESNKAGGFRAHTFISKAEMRPWQIRVCELHAAGKFDEANQIQKDNVNISQKSFINSAYIIPI